jgi:hypothetical protein
MACVAARPQIVGIAGIVSDDDGYSSSFVKIALSMSLPAQDKTQQQRKAPNRYNLCHHTSR